MPDGPATWLTAAACTVAPPPPTRFGDLPTEHRKDIVRLGFVSTIAFAYTLAMGILAQPIPSRSLHTQVALPHAAAPRSPLMEALLAEAPAAPTTGSAPRITGRSAGAGLRAVTATDAPGSPARTSRRGNVISRFFKGVWRTVS